MAKGAWFGLKNGRRRPHKKLSFHLLADKHFGVRLKEVSFNNTVVNQRTFTILAGPFHL
jgi:hypothetical protein